jgi:hypothetical protein
MSRPEFEPTQKDRELVESMSGYGVPFEQIAALVGGGIHRETLAKHFEKELVLGKAKANSKIGQTLFQKATGGDTTAMIWWSKTQMGWKETKEIEFTDKSAEKVTKIEVVGV